MSGAEASARTRAIGEWEPPDAERPRGRLLLLLFIAVPLAAVVVAAIAFRGFAVWVAAAFAAIGLAWLVAQRQLLLRNATTANADEQSPYIHIARGIAADLGVPVPRLYISRAAGANAFVVPGAIALTEQLVSSYTRTELEAVVAHCLVRLRDGGLRWALAGAALGSPALGAPRVDRVVDARTAAVTRYPPALAAAIGKASPIRGRTTALWFVAQGPSHAPVEERAAELADL